MISNKKRKNFNLNFDVTLPPELPQVEVLALTGKPIEGDVLTAVEVIPKSETQQSLWNKYKKDVRYQWYVPCCVICSRL